tara:strand:- start:17085 stop:17261 length:177 start_codon:yes stop_codon:yes gene_type:complete
MDDKEKMLIMAKLLRKSGIGPGGGNIVGGVIDVGIEELELRRQEKERERLAKTMSQGM